MVFQHSRVSRTAGNCEKPWRTALNLTEAKQRLGIHELWSRFGFPGTPSKSCRCPWRKDRSPSFSVTDDTVWHDFATGEGGDAVDFYAAATGLPIKEACRGFIAIAGGSAVSSVPRPPRQTSEEADFEKAAQRELWPLFEAGNEEDLSRLAALRHVSIDGLRLMSSRGLLFFTTWKGQRSWVVTDGARKNAQARRMDGLLWNGDGPKAWTLPGSEASRPIGAREALMFRTVLLVEGPPDALAAHHFVHAHGRQEDTAVVAMLGSSMDIHPASLPCFGGRKRLRLYPHSDTPGRDAAVRWALQLAKMKALVDAVNFTGLEMADGSQVKDLNDTTRIAPTQAHELSNLIPDNEDRHP